MGYTRIETGTDLRVIECTFERAETFFPIKIYIKTIQLHFRWRGVIDG